MIEKMKKFTFLVTNNEYEDFISSIRELGVVHVEQLQKGASSPKLQEAVDHERRFSAALQALDIAKKTYPNLEAQEVPAEAGESPLRLLEYIEQLQSREKKVLHLLEAVRTDIKQLQPWGDFDPEQVAALSAQCGMAIHFWRSSTKFFKEEWTEKYFAIPVTEQDKSTYFVTFSTALPDIQAERQFLPDGSLSSYEAQEKQLKEELTSMHAQMLYIGSKLRTSLEQGRTDMLNDIQMERTHLSPQMVAGDMVYLMLGWVQACKTEALVDYLEQSHIYYQMEDPEFEDDVPVRITNGSYTRLFEPILRMYSLPNYHDIDPSLFFAPFFMLFFGLCMGDGGYGLIVLIGGILMAKLGKADNIRSYGRLGIWLGLCTVVCGLLTGTVFGIDLTQQNWAILAPVKPYFLNDHGVGPIFGYSPMMVISIGIGFVQVLLGMILKGSKAWRNFGFAYAIGTFSWVVALLSALAAYGLPALGVVLPQWLLYGLMTLIGLSVIGIFLYNDPASYKRPALGLLSNIGGGIWNTYSMATGLLGDLLSYIRLFALGLTGGVLGGVFNSIALDMTSSLPWVVRWLPLLLILLAGHGITLALSLISAFVHPLRLTYVEFFKNANFEGGGREYSPFHLIKRKSQ